MVDTVLGLVVTPTNVQTVLVEGQSADGATLEHDEFDVLASEGEPVGRASEQVAEAVLNIAEAEGQRLHSIGVTWSDDADLEASRLLDSLSGLGLQNIVLVKQPQAAEALASSIGRVMGYDRTAVCVVEPDSVMISLVDFYDDDEETLVSRTIDSSDALIDWVTDIFERDDWRPEGLFVVGSVGGLDLVARELEAQLALPVFDPPEAELALAHGAALASANSASSQSLFADDLLDFTPGDFAGQGYAPSQRRTKGRSYTGPITMLVAGAVTFVASVSLALSLQLVSANTPQESPEVVKTAGTPAALPILPVLPAAPPQEIPVADTPPPPQAVDPAPEASPPAPEPDAPAYVPVPDASDTGAPAPDYVPPTPADVPAYVPPPAYVAPVAPQVPPEPQTPVRSWLKDKLHIGNNN